MKDPREYENYGQWMNDAGGTIPFKHCFSDICQRLDAKDADLNSRVAEIAKLKEASLILQDTLADIRSMTNDLYLKRMATRALSKFEQTIQR